MTARQVHIDALIIGAGPAGLMAADVLAASGRQVVVAESKPSIGRKFLMAGKSGLNLTKDENLETLIRAYGAASDWLDPMLRVFGPVQVQEWCRQLGQPVFTGSTGRVFPHSMKASPLLRAWANRLTDLSVALNTRWHWRGWNGVAAMFDTPEGPVRVLADVTVLALGGASWSRLGSDGAWAENLEALGVHLTPFAPANAGLCVSWTPHMAAHFGRPVKGAALTAGSNLSRGEFVISAKGLEGGGVYPLCPQIRDSVPVFLDLLPDQTVKNIAVKLAGRKKGKATLTTHLRKTLKLGPAQLALLREFSGGPLPEKPDDLAAAIKNLPVQHDGLRPLDEAISTAGGVARRSLDEGLMLHARPGVFCAGEMLDWEAPTGGYLLTGCLATGRWAGLAALDWLQGGMLLDTSPISPRLN